jgi:hypothetical protein
MIFLLATICIGSSTAQPVEDVEPALYSIHQGPIAPDLEARIQALEGRISELETVRSIAEKSPPVAASAPVGAVQIVPEHSNVPEISAMFQDVEVYGTVDGSVTVLGGDIRVLPTGVVHGDTVSIGGEVTVSPGGVVQGNRTMLAADMTTLSNPVSKHSIFSTAGFVNRLIFLLTFAGLGILVVGLFPNRIEIIANTIHRRPFRLFVTGALWTILLSALSFLFAILCIGVPISMVLMATLGIAWVLGFVSICQILGDRLPFAFKPHGRWLAFLMGSLCLTFASSLPWIGIFAFIITGVIGIGGAMNTRFGARPSVRWN